MKLGAIVLDTNNIEELSDFYAKLLGWNKRSEMFEGENWIIVSNDECGETPLVFQQNDSYVNPHWPSIRGRQQQMMHLDFYTSMDDFQSKVEHAIECGAKVAEVQFSKDWKVMLDPLGHPFCIIPIPKDFSK